MKQMTNENYEEVFSKMYKYVKEVTANYYLGDEMHNYFYYFLDHLLACEEKYEQIKSLNVPMELVLYDKDNFLDTLVYKTRKYLVRNCRFRGKLADIDFTNKCMVSARFVSDLCRKDGLQCYELEIQPGYSMSKNLFDGDGYHFANILKYRGEYYLVDVTYSQFFYSVRENLDRLGIVDFSCCNVGTFVLMEEDRVKLAINLLRDGYIKLEGDNLKTYLDSFTMSFRNGLYYENIGDFSYMPEYSVEDYRRFLSGEDDQTKHEGAENLGYQRKPLRNPGLDFRKR